MKLKFCFKISKSMFFSVLIVVGIFCYIIISLYSSYSNIGSANGKVINIANGNRVDSNLNKYADMKVKITSGTYKGVIVTVQDIVSETIKGQTVASIGDNVLLHLDFDKNGNIINPYVSEFIRYNYLLWLTILFVVLLIIIGGIKGLKSIITLALTGFAVLKIFIPLVLMGFDPVPISIVISICVIIISLIIISGKNKKTLAAIIGTCGGLIIAGLISYVATGLMRVKGLGDEETQMLIYMSHNTSFNFRGLLFAGILFGALGAIMDVGISIASSMNEILRLNKEISTIDLIKSGMNVGRDIMGSMANTLILAYVGSSMYILLLTSSYGMSLTKNINQDVIASEILKALAGSIGLVLTIPITAVTFGLLRNINIKKYFKYI